jgi:hypothetical protein
LTPRPLGRLVESTDGLSGATRRTIGISRSVFCSAAIDEEIDREPRYQPVAQDGAARAAGAISELL